MSKEKTKMTARIGIRLALLGSCALLASWIGGTASASAAVEWRSETMFAPSPLITGKTDQFAAVEFYNHGTTGSSGTSQVTLELPPGVTYNGKIADEPWGLCSGIGTATAVCDWPIPVNPNAYQEFPLGIDVAPGTLPGTYPWSVTVSGGGASTPSVETGTLTVGTESYGFGFTPGSVSGGSYGPGDALYTPAGGHPDRLAGAFDVNLVEPHFVANGNPKDVITELPPGVVGDPTAVSRCTHAQLDAGQCPPESQVGIARVRLGPPEVTPQVRAVYNLDPPADVPAELGFYIHIFKITGRPSIRADGDYGVRFTFKNLPEAIQPPRVMLSIWGTPADPSHDDQRCVEPSVAPVVPICNGYTRSGSLQDPESPVARQRYYPNESSAPRQAFITNPTNCADPVQTKLHISRYNDPPPNDDFSDPRWYNAVIDSPNHTGCELVPFDPTMSMQPTTKQADSPTGLDVNLHFPREKDDDPDELVQAHLKKATATLPEGMAFNTGVADGLEACTPEQMGLRSDPGELPVRFDNVEPSCPDASKIGSGEVITRLLEEHLRGEVFLASQKANPFNSNFAIYVVVREPSILVKLAGKVEPDPVTGQIKVTFDENPQLPFEDFIMHFYDGPRAALATPVTCGTFTSQTVMTPWSAEDPDKPKPSEVVTDPDSFTVDSSPAGSCATSISQLPFDIGLKSGSKDPIAGARSPFSVQITRPDANQELERLEISPPLGFTASLKGVPYCSEAQIAASIARASGKAEQQSPSCPVASEIGTTNVGAGAGPTPFYAPGKVYLSGPYKGEKLSVVVITPAVAGPFDLGNVVVRSALKLDPLTAQITAVTDPLPKTIAGVPLRVKDIRVDLDRPEWAINPTSCEEKQVKVTAFGSGGAMSVPTNRYRLDGCRNLGFKPKLSIRFKGGTKRGGHPALIAKLTTRPGDANIARAAVTLPRSAFLDQSHIRTICTRVQFAAEACPPAATYGYASVITPLLDDPLSGNVILRSSNNKLPDLVGDLKGVADIEAVGRIDSIKGGIRNTFDVVPDAPFDSFTLQMQGGKKGLVVNSQNLCGKAHRATVRLTAHNGRTYNFRPKVVATGCAKAKK